MFKDYYRTVCSTLAHNLITLRNRHALSKRAMAQILGISVYSLRVLEQGERLPDVDVGVLIRAATHFRVSVDDLLESRL